MTSLQHEPATAARGLGWPLTTDPASSGTAGLGWPTDQPAPSAEERP